MVVALGLVLQYLEQYIDHIAISIGCIHDFHHLKVEALSSSENNARQIRDAIMAMPPPAGAPRLVLVGYSKGAPDLLEAVVAYPEIRSRVVAVVSIAGA